MCCKKLYSEACSAEYTPSSGLVHSQDNVNTKIEIVTVTLKEDSKEEIQRGISEISEHQLGKKYAYLGTPYPQILDIFVGYNKTLCKTSIMYLMSGCLDHLNASL